MIFVTVGTQGPFDRLIQAVDSWAGSHPETDVFAQIGPSSLRPANLRWTDYLSPSEFRDKMTEADAVIAHAGVGTILAAMELGKPLLVLPRSARYREQRNDHQIATALHFCSQVQVTIALDEGQLDYRLRDLTRIRRPTRIGRFASNGLVQAVREFIGEPPAEAPSQSPNQSNSRSPARNGRTNGTARRTG